MHNNKSNKVLVGILAFLAIAGAAVLVIFPTLITGALKITAWAMLGVLGVITFAISHLQKSKEAAEAEKELEKQRFKRSKKLKEENEKREQKLEQLKDNLAKKEEKKAEKWEQVKSELVKEAGTVWSGRLEHAEQQENLARKIIRETKQMPVKNAAGQLALVWHETSAMAQWTAQQIIMFSQRPNVTTKAREEAQEAVIEAAEIREKGGNWTKEHGDKLADLKDKAREESQIEEKRLASIKDTIENAEIKWRASEIQIRRWQSELDKVYTDKK